MRAEQRRDRIAQIMGCAVELLREGGDQGLTMRRVAARVPMSLSNLQHYFKTRDALLIGLVDHYLLQTAEVARRRLEGMPPGRERFVALISASLEDPELAPICRVFKDIWALAERSPNIKQHLDGYYQSYALALSDELRSIAPRSSPQRVREAVSLVLPMVEGYAVTKDALPLDAAAMTRLLCEQVFALLGREG